MLKNPKVKQIIFAVTIPVCGFILLNLTFLFDFFFQSVVIGLIKLFTPVNFETNFQWLPPVMHFLFVTIIAIISFFVFRSKLQKLYKAMYMTVPMAVVLVTFGMFLYRWPVVAYALGSFFSMSVLYYLYRTKQPWLYYYTVIFVGLTMLLVGLLRVEI